MLHITKLFLFVVLLIPAIASAQNRPPVVDAGADQNVFTNDNAILTGTATDPNNDSITAWQWTVDSAPVSSSPYLSQPTRSQTVFRGDTPGDYVLSLIASDGLVWSAPDYVTIHVADLLPPVAAADATPISGTVPLTVQFDGSQSYDPQGGALTYRWNFGDQSPLSFEVSPAHTYITTGSFVAILDVYDGLGQSALDTVQITVSAPANQAPVASPTASPNSGPAPLAVAFAANASDPDGDALTYAWDFADGATSTVEDPSHVFTGASTYNVSITVSDGQEQATEYVTVMVDPDLRVIVDSIRVRFRGPNSTMGSASVGMSFGGGTPSASDVVRVVMDGNTLLDVPFGYFTRAANDNQADAGDSNLGLYKFKDKHIRAELDLTNGTIYVDRKGIDMAVLDNRNGVDTELHFGSLSALDNVVLLPGNGNTLVYDAGQ